MAGIILNALHIENISLNLHKTDRYLYYSHIANKKTKDEGGYHRAQVHTMINC